MKDFNFDLHVSTGLREDVENLKLNRQVLIEELAQVTLRIAKQELHVLIHDALTPQDEDKKDEESPAFHCSRCHRKLLNARESCGCTAQDVLPGGSDSEVNTLSRRRDHPF